MINFQSFLWSPGSRPRGPHACTQTLLTTKTTMSISLPDQSASLNQCCHFRGVIWLFRDLFFSPHVIFIRPGEMIHKECYVTDVSDSHISRAIRDLANVPRIESCQKLLTFNWNDWQLFDLSEKNASKNMITNELLFKLKPFVSINIRCQSNIDPLERDTFGWADKSHCCSPQQDLNQELTLPKT